MPTPKPGQWQYDMFTELYGHKFDEFDNEKIDQEKKVTLFDYENFFPAGLLKHLDTESDKFKEDIKRLNHYEKTRIE